MKALPSYQFADSALMEKKFSTSTPQDTSLIKPLEESDEADINLLIQTKQKQNIVSTQPMEEKPIEKKPLLELIDTAHFGVKEDAILSLPTRKPTQIETVKNEPSVTWFSPTINHHAATNWEIVILFSSLLIIAFARVSNQSRFSNIVKSVFSSQATHEIVRAEKVFFNRTNLLLNLVYFLSFSLFLYPYITINNTFSNEFKITTYFFVVLGLLLFYTIKLVSNIIINSLFDNQEISLEYSYITSLSNNIIGVIMLPILFLSNFTSLNQSVFFQKISFFIVLIFLLFRTIRYVKLALKKNNYILHIFLYLCTLEILPLIVIIKLFIV